MLTNAANRPLCPYPTLLYTVIRLFGVKWSRDDSQATLTPRDASTLEDIHTFTHNSPRALDKHS